MELETEDVFPVAVHAPERIWHMYPQRSASWLTAGLSADIVELAGSRGNDEAVPAASATVYVGDCVYLREDPPCTAFICQVSFADANGDLVGAPFLHLYKKDEDLQRLA